MGKGWSDRQTPPVSLPVDAPAYAFPDWSSANAIIFIFVRPELYCVHEPPLSRETNIPNAVPARTASLAGWIASVLMYKLPRFVLTAVKVPPPSVDLKTPPPTVPTKTIPREFTAMT